MIAKSRTQEQQQESPHQTTGYQGYLSPPANIGASEDAYLLELEMPGVSKDGLEITVEGNELSIIGRRQSTVPEGELCYCESNLADYRRVFELGPDVDLERISAEMQQGVLKLRLPKAAQAKPRKIEISG